MKTILTDGSDKDFAFLCHLLDNHLNEAVGKDKQRTQYDQYNKKEEIHTVFVVYIDDIPVACGGFKHYDTGTSEVKRVFVRKEYRHRGIATHVMKMIEKEAKNKGYARLILETGNMLAEAMALYYSLDYHIIENYGQYKQMKESVCMQKIIT
ncbi:MAG: GNAT family N-acetyltransferase [Clostridia bacterium]|nr:GNAT family N-acetyltransferase [Clostridia bacterium]